MESKAPVAFVFVRLAQQDEDDTITSQEPRKIQISIQCTSNILICQLSRVSKLTSC